MYKVVAILNVELGLRIHRRCINRLLMAKKSIGACMTFQSVVRRWVGSIRCRGEKVSR